MLCQRFIFEMIRLDLSVRGWEEAVRAASARLIGL
jgi:mannitol/fructose-specific phosphotransferase system IIA component (Ntr-type)